jgi:ABC-type nitrate/sulfonate/bicarbonate transport system substrate-binding protein
MTTLRKLLALLVIVFVLSAGSDREGWSQSQTLTTFYTAPVVSMAPMWIAKEVGFFRKQGLDVRVVFIPSGPTGTTAILAGEADAGIIGGFAPIRGRSWVEPKA